MMRSLLLVLSLCQTIAVASSDSVVVFNEIMYHPQPDDAAEWIELHNQMSVDIDLSRWQIEGGTHYQFPEGTIISGGGYLIITSDPAAIAGALGPLSGRLDNAGDSLRLLSASGRMMNEVRYNDRGDWPLAPDGSGVSLAKVNLDSAAPHSENWTWSAQIGGTPGEVNFETNRVPARSLVINEVGPASEEGFWLEFYNRGDSPIDLNGYLLSHPSLDAEHGLEGNIDAGGFLVVGDDQWKWATNIGNNLYLYTPGRAAVADAVEVRRRGRVRFPDGSEEWMIPTEPTPGQSNQVSLNTDIVINEIFYHHPPQYADGDLPFMEIDDEWIELFNRGTTEIDLSGWEISGDIRYTFDEGVTLNPGGYLVIDNSENGFRGELSNRSGVIELEDAAGNLADFVHYHDDGHWPTEADGGGSSLELRDPHADNANPDSWAPSDESSRHQWQEIRYRGIAQRSPVGPDNQWRELVFGFLDRGECLIDDVRVVGNPDGAGTQLISNTSFQRTIFGGAPLRDWRPRGTHRHSHVVPDPEDPNNNVLHVIATGPTGHMHNQLEAEYTNAGRVSNGETYEISFRARYLNGSPQLLTRLYFNRLPKTHILITPEAQGTPGAPNSRLIENLGPTLSSLSHSPAVPAADETCEVSVQVEDPDGISQLTLFWSVESGEFQEIGMASTEEGRYSASIPPQAANAVIQFYVEATDSKGALSWSPPLAEHSRALYQVDDPGRAGTLALNHFRIILTPDDEDWIHDAINLMSNDRIPATVIYKEEEIFYDVGVRLKGSERGRVTNQRLGFNVKFPNQQRFRGTHRTVAIDRSEGVNFGQFEILFNQMMTHSGGVPSEFNDLIHVISPRSAHTGAAELQLARYGSIFLDSQFENGSEGNLYEYELIYYPTTADADGYKRPQPDFVVGTGIRDIGDDKEEYRWNYLLKNNRDRDDFEGMIQYAKLFSMPDDAFQAALPSLVNVDGWLQGMAFAILSGAGDQYGANSQHNGMFYQQADGLFTYFPHDLDFAFNASRSVTENNDLKKILRNPAYERMYLAHVNNILETTYNERYMQRWADHFGELLPGQNFQRHLDYIASRSRNVASQVNRMAPERTFLIATNNGQDFEINESSVIIEGRGGLSLHRLRHEETGDLIAPEWTDLDRWQITIPLEPGPNEITLQGLDILGGTGSLFSPVGRDQITVTNQSGVGPANSENLVITEILYDPAAPDPDEQAAGFSEANLFEFIELANHSDHSIDLSDVVFTNGVSVNLSGQLAAGEHAVVVKNQAAFAKRYGAAVRVLAEWETAKLNNQGERLTLEREAGEVIQSFRYDNQSPWPALDEEGFSIVFTGSDNTQGGSWELGAMGGTPGKADEGTNDLLDSVSQLTVSLVDDERFQLRYERSTTPGISYTIESSDHLTSWTSLTEIDEDTETIPNDKERVTVIIPRSQQDNKYVRIRVNTAAE